MSEIIPNIILAAPVRNRDWILEEYLKHIKNLDYPKGKIGLHFLLNDSSDESVDILEDFRWHEGCYYKYIHISNIELGYPADCCEDGDRYISKKDGKFRRDLYSFPALSFLRNMLLDLASLDKKADYLFSIDTDILVEPDVLSRLLKAEKDIVAALVKNGGDVYNWIPFEYRIIPEAALSDLAGKVDLEKVKSLFYKIIDREDLLEQLRVLYPWEDAVKIFNRSSLVEEIKNNDYPIAYGGRDETFESMFKVKTTGAVYIISRKVFTNKKIRYSPEPKGEDSGFCTSARKEGYSCFVLPYQQKHIMRRDEAEELRKEKEKKCLLV